MDGGQKAPTRLAVHVKEGCRQVKSHLLIPASSRSVKAVAQMARALALWLCLFQQAAEYAA